MGSSVAGSPMSIPDRLARGEPADLVIMAGAGIDRLIAEGRVAEGSRVDLAGSGIGIAVRAGAPRPAIGSAEALKQSLLEAQSVAHSTSASGIYIKGLLQRLGVTPVLAERIRPVEGEPVGRVVARGEAEIGFQQMSELLPVRGIDIVGPLPPEIQEITMFSAGLAASAMLRPAPATDTPQRSKTCKVSTRPSSPQSSTWLLARTQQSMPAARMQPALAGCMR